MQKMTLKNIQLVCSFKLSDINELISIGNLSTTSFCSILRDITWLKNLGYIDLDTANSLYHSAADACQEVD